MKDNRLSEIRLYFRRQLCGKYSNIQPAQHLRYSAVSV